jgi:cytochrome b
MSELTVKEYKVWDLPTRLFHWINVIAVIMLMFVGLIMLNKSALGIQSTEAKIALKELHVIIGYVFAANLLWRFVWAFIGNKHARWSAILPRKGFGEELKSYIESVKAGKPKQYVGHNPAGRLSILLFYIILSVMMVSGMIRAGTDIYFPPFGSFAASYVAQEGVDPATIKPYDKSYVNADRYKAMGSFKKPIGTLHIYLSYFLMFVVVVHIAAVVKAELAGAHGLVSAMLTGKKRLADKPADNE